MASEDDQIDSVKATADKLLMQFSLNGGGQRPPPPAAVRRVSDDNDPMEARVTAIENRLDRMDERLTRVEVKIDHIEKEVGQTKWWILGQIVAGLLAVLGTGIAIQQMTVTTFQAAGQDRAAQTPAQAVQPIIIQLPAQQAPAK